MSQGAEGVLTTRCPVPFRVGRTRGRTGLAQLVISGLSWYPYIQGVGAWDVTGPACPSAPARDSTCIVAHLSWKPVLCPRVQRTILNIPTSGAFSCPGPAAACWGPATGGQPNPALSTCSQGPLQAQTCNFAANSPSRDTSQAVPSIPGQGRPSQGPALGHRQPLHAGCPSLGAAGPSPGLSPACSEATRL